MKRETVLRMLNKQFHESKRMLQHSIDYNDMVNVMGGNYDEEKENQFKENMKTDISQLSFLIRCYKNKDMIENILNNNINDGFGNVWNKICPECNQSTMQVLRPGKVQCSNCG